DYLDPEKLASVQCCPLTILGPDVSRRPDSRQAVGHALGGMLAALRQCIPGQGQQQALAALSTMVGAVVLARLADEPALSRKFLQAAADSVLSAGLLPPTKVTETEAN